MRAEPLDMTWIPPELYPPQSSGVVPNILIISGVKITLIHLSFLLLLASLIRGLLMLNFVP